jgi:hypothetical protein
LKEINDVSVTPVGAVTTIEYTMSILVQKTESSVYSFIVTKLGSALTLHYYSDPDDPVAVILIVSGDVKQFNTSSVNAVEAEKVFAYVVMEPVKMILYVPPI